MKKIEMTTSQAASNAMQLAREYETSVLAVLADVPVPAQTRRLVLKDLGLALRGYGTEYKFAHPFDKAPTGYVRITAENLDVPDDETRQAFADLTLNAITGLNSKLSAEAILASANDIAQHQIDGARRLQGASRFRPRRLRRADWTSHLIDALNVQRLIPVTGQSFEQCFASTLFRAGFSQDGDAYRLLNERENKAHGLFTKEDVGTERVPTSIRAASAEDAQAFFAWRETILVWAYESTLGTGGDSGEDLVDGTRRRFSAAIARKLRKQEAEEAERVRVHSEHIERQKQAEAVRRRNVLIQWQLRDEARAEATRRETLAMLREYRSQPVAAENSVEAPEAEYES